MAKMESYVPLVTKIITLMLKENVNLMLLDVLIRMAPVSHAVLLSLIILN